MTSSKMLLSAEGSVRIMPSQYKKTGQSLKKFHNGHLMDWRNWNKSLFGKNL